MVDIRRYLSGLSVHRGTEGPGPRGNKHGDQGGRWQSPVQPLTQAARAVMEQTAKGPWSTVSEAGDGWGGCQRRLISAKREEVQSVYTIRIC